MYSAPSWGVSFLWITIKIDRNLRYTGDMELSREMKFSGIRTDKKSGMYELEKFTFHQRMLFKTLQERGFYLKGIVAEDLIEHERERFFRFSLDVWRNLKEFEKV